MDWEKILSIVTAITAVIGIYLTRRQIVISNKQALFEHRIKILGYVCDLINIYEDNKDEIFDDSLSNDNPDFAADYKFLLLTNISEFKDVSKVIKNPISSSLHTEFLVKLSELSRLAQNLKLLYHGDEGELISCFVEEYQNVLRAFYKYQIVLNRLEKENREGNKTLRQLQKNIGEPKAKKRLEKQLRNLDLAYQEVVNRDCIQKLKEETRLE